MTWWSLRRRLGANQGAKRKDRQVTAAPAAGFPSAPQLSAGQPSAGQPASSQQVGTWFEPGWGRPAQPGPAQPGISPYGPGEPSTGQYSAGQYGAGQYSAGEYGADQYGGSQSGASQPGGGVGVLTPGQPAGPAQSPAFTQPADSVTAAAWDARAESGQAEPAPPGAGGPWPDICDQFGLHLLVLAEQLRTSLDELEADEGDPERLRRLYQVDHAVTRMRRASRDLRTLAGRSEEELAGFTTSLLDVIRMAASAIERYTQVTVGRVTDLAVLGYAADDIGALVAALLDNATRYSPGTVTVSGHLLEDGSVMFRIEDTGIGIGADQVAALNAALAGSVPDVDERTGRHTGFPVVHRIARKHFVGVRLASRPLPSSGTVAMVTLPPHLLCEVPAEEAQLRPASATGSSAHLASPQRAASRTSGVTDLPRGEQTTPQQQPPQAPQWEPPELPDRDQPRLPGELPRRERASLRGEEPRPQEHPALTPQQQAAARLAFADELTAFSLGAGGFPGSADDTALKDGTALEEETKP